MQVLVLWEHGFIDKLRLKSYTLNERPDAIRFDQKEFSLKLLMGYCLDFEEKETLLQSMAGKGNGSTVLVEPTPKCH